MCVIRYSSLIARDGSANLRRREKKDETELETETERERVCERDGEAGVTAIGSWVAEKDEEGKEDGQKPSTQKQARKLKCSLAWDVLIKIGWNH